MDYKFGVTWDNMGVDNYKLFYTIKEANDFMIRTLSIGHWAVLWDKQDAPKIYLSNRHEVKK